MHYQNAILVVALFDNNLNYKQIDIRLDTFSNIKLDSDTTYDVKYTLDLDEYNIYRFIEPTIVYTTFDNNSINNQDSINYFSDYKKIYFLSGGEGGRGI